ncbi:hypothetical protein ACFVUP_37570 [Streptomyces bacillaris]|uniref:hypothetical protein n=1 Tax=Streptomyces bacillaris TaxID=68179 RepID=UPI0036DC109F
MSPSTRRVGIGLTVVLLLTGCTATPSAGTLESAIRSTAAATLGTPTRAPQDAGQLLDAAQRTIEQGAAIAVAERAMHAYARPALPASVWLEGIAGFLTPQAVAAYRYTDPSQVPVTAVTGVGVAGAGEDYVTNATVTVPTNVGTYTLQLTRPELSAGWLVNVITDPQGNS